MSLFKKEAPPEPVKAPSGGPPSSAPQMAVMAIQYTVVKTPLIHLEWAKDRKDYVYQWKTLKQSALGEAAILARLMAATDDCLPRETQVFFDQPAKELDFPFWTIRVKDIVDRPGAQEACEGRLVDRLSKLNVWT